ncbi:MAG: chemotaxis protein CheD [Phycisphaerales bacterium]|nr:chemotaxis protein CheD [Phycisphaerales bacterium]
MTSMTGQVSSGTSPKAHVVGVADYAVLRGPTNEIITHALGSCIGVTIFDPTTHVGGMLHFMLPDSKINNDKASDSPAMFADTGIPLLFKHAYELGAKKENLIVCAAGGAEVLSDGGHFKIGSRNRTVLRKIFWKNNVLLSADDTGGNNSRTLHLSLADGTVTVRNRGKGEVLWPI